MPHADLSRFSSRQELPYHLEQLLDNNRLTRCLLEWEVFGRLFNDDFSIDLLRSWQKVREALVSAKTAVFLLLFFTNDKLFCYLPLDVFISKQQTTDGSVQISDGFPLIFVQSA